MFVSIAIPEVAVISHRQAGVIGVDINADRLAVTETDRFGNPIGSWVIPCVTYGRTSERRAAIVGDAVKQVVAIAVDRRKPIAIEKLDFWKKRATLEAQSGKHARMLCAFAYRRIQAVIRARSYEAGIEVLETNPAYSSLIGKYKFASRYGLSAHNAAACVIARRVDGLGERLPSQFQVTPQLLAKNRSGHVWSLWASVSPQRRSGACSAEEAGWFNNPIPGGTGSCEHGPPRDPASPCRCDPGTRTVLSTVRRTSWAMGISVHVSRNGTDDVNRGREDQQRKNRGSQRKRKEHRSDYKCKTV